MPSLFLDRFGCFSPRQSFLFHLGRPHTVEAQVVQQLVLAALEAHRDVLPRLEPLVAHLLAFPVVRRTPLGDGGVQHLRACVDAACRRRTA